MGYAEGQSPFARGLGGCSPHFLKSPKTGGYRGLKRISKQLLRICYTTRQTGYILGLDGYLLIWR